VSKGSNTRSGQSQVMQYRQSRFGMPIVMNPMMMLPFILAPVLTVIATYIGMSTGLVAKPAGIAVPWTMPPILHGYLITGGKISGAVMQLINILIAFVVYYPFFRMWDKQKLIEEGGPSTINSKDSNIVNM
jgi:cellobiose PTS system EIIC component